MPIGREWQGQTAVILGGGPSLASLTAADLRDIFRSRCKVIAVNRAFEICPGADILFWSDRRFARGREDALRAFRGRKATTSHTTAKRFGAYYYCPSPHIDQNAKGFRIYCGPPLETDPAHLAGIDSGHRAVNLAVHLGARKIILVAFDMHAEADGRCNGHDGHVGENGERLTPNPDIYPKQLIPAWTGVWEAARRMGCDIVNATPGSALIGIPIAPLAEALLPIPHHLIRPTPTDSRVVLNVPRDGNGHHAAPMQEKRDPSTWVGMTWAQECRAPAKFAEGVMEMEDTRFPPRTKEFPPPQKAAGLTYKGPITVACVFYASARFNSEHVNRLYRGVSRNLTRKLRFVCLTNSPGPFDAGVEVVQLRNGSFPDRRYKIQLFRPDFLSDFGRVLFLDLDTIICGSLEDIVSYDGKFAMLRDISGSPAMGSGVMLWSPEPRLAEIYYDWTATPPEVMEAKYPDMPGKSDQLFIRHNVPIAPHLIQEMFPGQCASYKKHIRKLAAAPPVMPRLVFFHGSPQPSEIDDQWLLAHWK